MEYFFLYCGIEPAHMKGSGWGMGWYYFCGRKFLKREINDWFLWDNCTVKKKRGGIICYLSRKNLQIYCTLDLNPYPSNLKYKSKVKNWADLNQHPYDQQSMMPPLSYECLCCWKSFVNPTEKLLCTCKIFGFDFTFVFLILCSNISVTTSLSSSVLRTADCSCKSCRFKSLQKFSCDS